MVAIETKGNEWDELRYEVLDSCSIADLAGPITSEIGAIVDQPWRFLSDGGTAVVFAGSKTPHVLKIFKSVNGYLRKFHSWGIDIASVAWAAHPGDGPLTAAHEIRRTQQSVALAWRELRAETGLVYAHLSPTDDHIDLLIEHERLRANRLPFLVQHRADLAGTVLKDAVRNGDLAGAKSVIDTYLDLLVHLGRRSISPTNFFFDHNTGFLPTDLSILTLETFQPDGIQCCAKSQRGEF